MKKRKTILILDGHNLAYRCYHQPAYQRFKNSEGKPSGVFYGFLTGLHKLIQQFKPHGIFVVFDSISGVQLLKSYKGYKANRTKPKRSFLRQMKDIQKILACLSVKVIYKDGYEADDLIFGLALSMRGYPVKTIIVTADHDLLQCINKHTWVYDDRFKKFWNRQSVKEHYRFSSTKIPLYKALAGDRTDGVKGTPGIGKKIAVKLIRKYKWEPDILKQLNGKQQEEFRFSLKAVKLRTSFELQSFIHAFLKKKRLFKPKKALKALKKYQCVSLINKFPQWSEAFKTEFHV